MVSSEMREVFTSLHVTGFEVLTLAEMVRVTSDEVFRIADPLLEEVASMTEFAADEAASITDFLFEEAAAMTDLVVEAAGWMTDVFSQVLSRATSSVMEF